MTVVKIVEKYIIENGFDGLVNKDMGCGCPAGSLICPLDDCESAYAYIFNKKGCESCEVECPLDMNVTDDIYIYDSRDLPVKCRKK
ncbi:MAG: hypothetical protein LBK69_05440 [Syntrophomonadaceae bacterium]|jgi:hypothetical protein|nr:hypothetical protein [Syntrophomonadaceae bacterium]